MSKILEGPMSNLKPGRGADQFPLRLPQGMRERIKEAADASGRSMNAEIVARLEASLRPGGGPTRTVEIDGQSVMITEALVEAIVRALLGTGPAAGGSTIREHIKTTPRKPGEKPE